MSTEVEANVAEASLAIDISDCAEDPCYVLIELDEDANDGQTSFRAGDKIFLKVYSNTYPDIGSTGGHLVGYDEAGGEIEATEVPEQAETVTEQVAFTEWKASATKAIVGGQITSVVWKGVTLGEIEVSQSDLRTLSVAAPEDPITGEPIGKGYGVAEITYTTNYRSYSIACNSAMAVVVYVYGTLLTSLCASSDPDVCARCTEEHTSITVEFNEDEPECVVQMELDSELNKGKTSFEIGARAYFRVYSNFSATPRATCMTPSRYSENVAETIEDEYITFKDGFGNATRPVRSITKKEWVGAGLGKVRAINRSTKLGSAITEKEGVLRITYRTVYDVYSVTSNEEGKCFVVAYDGSSGSASRDAPGEESEEPAPSPSVGFLDCSDTDTSLVIDFIESQNKYMVVIAVQDAITGEAVPDAVVTIDAGEYVGVTDEGGLYPVGKMVVGTHGIKVEVTGYTRTDIDGLDNDTFVVTEVEE